MSLRRLLAAFAATLLIASGCGDDEPSPGTLVIRLDHEVDGAPLALNTGTYTNAAGNDYKVSKLEYVLTDFHLHAAGGLRDHAGGDFESAGPYYRTETDATTREITFEDVPAGEYAELSFVFGIVAAENLTGAFPSLDEAGMAWPAAMGQGYHYMRNEGTFADTAGTSPDPGFLTHFGPSMGGDYSIGIELDTDGLMVEESGTTTIRLVMNVNEWYTGPTDYSFETYNGPIMGNPGAQQILQGNGGDVWSVEIQ